MSFSSKESKRDSKEAVYDKVLSAALTLDFKKGHQRWTISELSRVSGVTRSLIYYYFGRSREGILTEAIQMIGEELFGMHPRRLELWSQGKIADSVIQSRKELHRNPYLGTFYLTHRVRKTDLGEICRRFEKEHIKKMQRFLPKAKKEELEGLFALLFGLVFAPNVSEKAVYQSVSAALKTLR